MFEMKQPASSTTLPYSIGEAILSDIPQMAELSAQNMRTVISEADKQTQGFITWHYDEALLTAMHAIAPSIVAKQGDTVVGYALVALREMASVHPDLSHMLRYWSGITYQGKPLDHYRYYMMGQICVAREHRGQYLTDRMYQYHKAHYEGTYDLLLTEISTSNPRSQKAHERAGFQTIHTYRDKVDEWNIVCWDWTLP